MILVHVTWKYALDLLETLWSPVWLAALVLHPKFKWQNIDQLWQHQVQRSLYTASRVRVQRLWLTHYKNQIRPTISEEVPRDAYDSIGDKDIFHGFTHSQTPISQEANGMDDEYTRYISRDRPEEQIPNPIKWWAQQLRDLSQLVPYGFWSLCHSGHVIRMWAWIEQSQLYYRSTKERFEFGYCGRRRVSSLMDQLKSSWTSYSCWVRIE